MFASVFDLAHLLIMYTLCVISPRSNNRTFSTKVQYETESLSLIGFIVLAQKWVHLVTAVGFNEYLPLNSNLAIHKEVAILEQHF